jgi:hypothetical protein
MPEMGPAFSDGMLFMQNLSMGHIGFGQAPMPYGAMQEWTMQPCDQGRDKFLEIQKKEWNYTPPSPFTSNHYKKSDFEWIKPTTPIEPIYPIHTEPFTICKSLIDKWQEEGLRAATSIHELYKSPILREPSKPIENPLYVNKKDKKEECFSNGFGFQPINDIFPKKGSMHDSFNVSSSGDIFNGHTTVDLGGTTKKARLPWEMDLNQKTNLFNK